MNKITNYLKEQILAGGGTDFTNVVISDTIFDENIELLENLNVVHQQPISNITKLPTEIKIITTLTPELGTFNVKCIGFTDSNDKLLAVVKIPEFTKEAGKGSYKFTTILSIDTENITINQTNEIFATREEVESLKQQVSILQTQIKSIVPPENLERFKILKFPSTDDYVLSIVRGIINFLEYQINYFNENSNFFINWGYNSSVSNNDVTNVMFSYLAGLDFAYLKSGSVLNLARDYIKYKYPDINLEQLEKIKQKNNTSSLSFSFNYEGSSSLIGNEYYYYSFKDSNYTNIFLLYFYYTKGKIEIYPIQLNNNNILFSRLLLTALGMSGVIQSDIVDNVVQNFPNTTINVIGTTKLKVKEDLFKLQTPGVTPEATITFTMPESSNTEENTNE